MKYYIPDCYWPVDDNGTYKSHEAISILNTSANDIVAGERFHSPVLHNSEFRIPNSEFGRSPINCNLIT